MSRLIQDITHHVLVNAPIDTATKADCWDHFYASRNAKGLAIRLQPLGLPEPVYTALIEARKSSHCRARCRVFLLSQKAARLTTVIKDGLKTAGAIAFILACAIVALWIVTSFLSDIIAEGIRKAAQ